MRNIWREKRKFNAMTPADSYDLIEFIVGIREWKYKLVLYKRTKIVEEQEESAKFWLNKNTPTGVICKVINDKQIQYNGEIYALYRLAIKLIESKWTVQKLKYFKYHDKWFNDICKRKEGEEIE